MFGERYPRKEVGCLTRRRQSIGALPMARTSAPQPHPRLHQRLPSGECYGPGVPIGRKAGGTAKPGWGPRKGRRLSPFLGDARGNCTLREEEELRLTADLLVQRRDFISNNARSNSNFGIKTCLPLSDGASLQSRKSNLLRPQRLHRIKLRRLPRRDQARNKRNL
jgi:hypothetical protein